jgi:hypothetical protein
VAEIWLKIAAQGISGLTSIAEPDRCCSLPKSLRITGEVRAGRVGESYLENLRAQARDDSADNLGCASFGMTSKDLSNG